MDCSVGGRNQRRVGNGGLTGASSGDGATAEAILPDRFNKNGILDADLLSV